MAILFVEAYSSSYYKDNIDTHIHQLSQSLGLPIHILSLRKNLTSLPFASCTYFPSQKHSTLAPHAWGQLFKLKLTSFLDDPSISIVILDSTIIHPKFIDLITAHSDKTFIWLKRIPYATSQELCIDESYFTRVFPVNHQSDYYTLLMDSLATLKV